MNSNGPSGSTSFTLINHSPSDLTFLSPNSIKKTGSSVGPSSASTSESYPFNSCFLSFRLHVHSSSNYIVALSKNDKFYSYGFSFQNGNVYLYYNNKFGSPVSKYSANDTFSISIKESSIYWYKNNIEIGKNVLLSGNHLLKLYIYIFAQNDVIDHILCDILLPSENGTTAPLESTSIIGPTGPMGSIGLQGPVGPMGISGPRGEIGPTGPIGIPGNRYITHTSNILLTPVEGGIISTVVEKGLAYTPGTSVTITSKIDPIVYYYDITSTSFQKMIFNKDTQIELFMIGGGGGGGTIHGGGGGAGAYYYTNGKPLSISSGTTFNIKVGVGGTGGKNDGNSYQSVINATNGGDTGIIMSGNIYKQVKGGGAGGSYHNDNHSGAIGGCGGGGNGYSINNMNCGTINGGNANNDGTNGTGNKGGLGRIEYFNGVMAGGGGGGIGAVGESVSTYNDGYNGGNGGAGLVINIIDKPIVFGGGGGGGCWDGANNALHGKGGGAFVNETFIQVGGSASIGSYSNQTKKGENGVENTGSGGGGGGSFLCSGGDGGSGRCIIKIVSPSGKPDIVSSVPVSSYKGNEGLNRFQGYVESYDVNTGNITINSITNVSGSFKTSEIYTINLGGIDANCNKIYYRNLITFSVDNTKPEDNTKPQDNTKPDISIFFQPTEEVINCVSSMYSSIKNKINKVSISLYDMSTIPYTNTSIESIHNSSNSKK